MRNSGGLAARLSSVASVVVALSADGYSDDCSNEMRTPYRPSAIGRASHSKFAPTFRYWNSSRSPPFRTGTGTSTPSFTVFFLSLQGNA